MIDLMKNLSTICIHLIDLFIFVTQNNVKKLKILKQDNNSITTSAMFVDNLLKKFSKHRINTNQSAVAHFRDFP